jgi:hypothetical protein
VVTEQDRAAMRRLADALAESQTDDRGTAEQRRELLAIINEGRRRAGRPPLSDAAPEEGLHERARSLGMARIDR